MRYKPSYTSKGKIFTELTNNHGGIHDPRQFKQAIKMIETALAEWDRPRLSHICLTGADVKTYIAALNRFKRKLTSAGVTYAYKAALEEDSQKGLHLHIMLLIDHKRAGKHTNPYGLISDNVKSPLCSSMDRFHEEGLEFNICTSRYSKDRFLPILKKDYESLNQAVEWCSYIYKQRSKEGLQGRIYYSSRNNAFKTDLNVPGSI